MNSPRHCRGRGQFRMPGAPRGAAFGQVVSQRGQAGSCGGSRPNMIGSIGLARRPDDHLRRAARRSTSPLPALWRAYLVRHVRADHHGARAHHADPARPARPARLLPRAGHPAPPVDHPGTAVLAARRAGRRPAVHRAGSSLAIVNIASVAAFGAPVPKSPARARALKPAGHRRALRPRAADRRAGVDREQRERHRLAGPHPAAVLRLPACGCRARSCQPVLLDISNYTPLGAAVEAIQDSVQTGFPRPRRCWSWPGTPWSSPSWRAASSAGSKHQGGLWSCPPSPFPSPRRHTELTPPRPCARPGPRWAPGGRGMRSTLPAGEHDPCSPRGPPRAAGPRFARLGGRVTGPCPGAMARTAWTSSPRGCRPCPAGCG